jgi:Fe2+ transport system protein B
MTNDQKDELMDNEIWTVKVLNPNLQENLVEYHIERDHLPEEPEEKSRSATVRSLMRDGLRAHGDGLDLDEFAKQKEQLEARITELEDEVQQRENEIEELRERYKNPSAGTWFNVTARTSYTIKNSLLGGTVALLFVVAFLFQLFSEQWADVTANETLLKLTYYGVLLGLLWILAAPIFSLFSSTLNRFAQNDIK